MKQVVGAPLETELDDDGDIEDMPDDLSSDSDDGHIVPHPAAGPAGVVLSPATPTGATTPTTGPKDITETSYLVKRMNQSNGTIFYQTRGGAAAAAAAAAVAAAAAKAKKSGQLI